MKPQRFRVVDVPWREPAARQCSVQLETETGQRFVCFVDGQIPETGSALEVESFYWIANEDISFDRVFSLNPEKEKKLDRLGDWDYMAYGQVVESDGDDLVVNCGGVLIPLAGISRDRQVLGAWVGFKVERLEAGLR